MVESGHRVSLEPGGDIPVHCVVWWYCTAFSISRSISVLLSGNRISPWPIIRLSFSRWTIQYSHFPKDYLVRLNNGLTSNFFNQARTRLAVNSEPLSERMWTGTSRIIAKSIFWSIWFAAWSPITASQRNLPWVYFILFACCPNPNKCYGNVSRRDLNSDYLQHKNNLCKYEFV